MASRNLTKLHPTKHRGISYRLRADGSRLHYVYFKGTYHSKAEDRQPLLELDAAIERQGQLVGHRRRGEQVRRPEKVTFETAAAAYMEHALNRPKKPLREGTAKEYRRHLETILIPRFGQRLIGSIQVEEIEELTAELMGEGGSESTVDNKLKPLRGTFRFAHRQKKWISRNPVEEISDDYRISCNATRKHHEWTSSEVDRLIWAGHERDARPTARRDYGLAIEVKVRLGPRLGELLGLQYRDFLADGPVVTIERQWTKDGRVAEVKTKAGVRRVPIESALLKKIIERKLRLGAGDEDFVFASERGGLPPQHGNFRRRGWYPAIEEAGLVAAVGIKITPHDARRAFASQMTDEDLNSSDVARALGHSSARVTEQIYIASFNREQREARIREAMERASGS